MATHAAFRWLGVTRRFGTRLVAAMLVVSLPLLILLGVLLTNKASASLSAAGESKGVAVARAVTLRVEAWVSERQRNVSIMAGEASDQSRGEATAELKAADKAYGDFSLIQLTDLTGRVLASSRDGVSLDVAGRDWFRTAVGGKSVVTSPARQGDQIHWIIAQPVLGSDGKPQAVLVADLNTVVLADLLNPDLAEGSTIFVVDAQHQLVYTTERMGKLADDRALLAAGALSTTVDNTATRQAAETGQPGTARFSDLDGDDVIGGYDVLEALGWVVIAQDHASAVLAPATDQRNRAILIVTLGTLLALAVSIGVAWRTTRPVRRLTEAVIQGGPW